MAEKQWVGSPNYTQGRGGLSVLGVIIHWMAGNLASADSTFQDRNRNTSAHFGIEDNKVHEYVNPDDTAYQAGNWIVNEQTIGIEHSAQPGRAPSDATYENSAQIVAEMAQKYGFPIDTAHVRHHYEIVATACPGPVPGDGVDENRIIRRALELAGGHAPGPVAPVPTPANVAGTATVEVDLLYVRSEPNHNAPLAGSQQLTRGQTFDFQGAVQGELVNGVSTWLHSTRGNYVWAGGTDYPTTPTVSQNPAPPQGGGTAEAIRVANVRVAPNTGAALGGSRQLQPGQTFGFSALVHGENVSQNGVTSDLWYHSNVGNYVWAGNCKTL